MCARPPDRLSPATHFLAPAASLPTSTWSGSHAFAKALDNETSRPTLVIDVLSLMGSLVDQTESQTSRLEFVEKIAMHRSPLTMPILTRSPIEMYRLKGSEIAVPLYSVIPYSTK